MQMMFRKDEFKVGYVEEVRSQVLELPYAGEELSMVILLPDEDTDLVAVSLGNRSVDPALAPLFKGIHQIAFEEFPV